MKVFITSTGTDVGKTYVTLLLYRALSAHGYHVGLYKPFQTEEQADGTYPDLEAYRKVSSLDYETTSLYRFHEPVSPHLGFKLEPHQQLNRSAVIEKANQLAAHFDVVLIEGAGGLGVPIHQDQDKFYMTEDLIKDTADKVISVVPSQLGAISDIIMHQYYLTAYHLPENILIMNRFSTSMIAQDNYETLTQYLARPIYTLSEGAEVREVSEALIETIMKGEVS
ncbi:dethiobiotin synthase [Staphylococcus simulans]|uniref:dethiobiotin synthase n=1 Tax=Staphylococcus simulans TaxID=1286 RepID=UPI001E5D717B|nr:dethiobiotin synthase [Staphylococcus simulans]MCD8916286.1 dethiobiotin synthase [Staphylococcus simulans]